MLAQESRQRLLQFDVPGQPGPWGGSGRDPGPGIESCLGPPHGACFSLCGISRERTNKDSEEIIKGRRAAGHEPSLRPSPACCHRGPLGWITPVPAEGPRSRWDLMRCEHRTFRSFPETGWTRCVKAGRGLRTSQDLSGPQALLLIGRTPVKSRHALKSRSGALVSRDFTSGGLAQL